MKSLNSARCVPLLLALAAPAAHAIEAGVDTYGLGAEGTLAGALPPPGLYGIVYQNHYEANRFVGDSGQSAVPGFRVRSDSITPRLIWMSNTTIAGGQLGGYALMPIVHLQVDALGASDSRTGNGDLLLGPLLAYHRELYHWGYALEFVLPIGQYDRDRLANPGRNYLTVRPIFGWSYHDPVGWDLSTKMSLNFNGRNKDTDYRSGNYLAGDYTVGYHVTPRFLLGLEGYFLKQFSDDRQQGASVDGNGNRARVLGVGAGVQYQALSGYSLEGKIVSDTNTRNRADGTSVWLRAAWRF